MTEKQKRFADEYLIDLNATRSYKTVYHGVKSDEAAAVNASKLLRNPKVLAYISARMKDRQERTEITQDRVLEELAAIAFADVTDVAYVKDGTVFVKDTENLTKSQKKAIAGIKQSNNGIEIKMNDKRAALELLGRHLGMWRERIDIEHSGSVNNPFSNLSIEELRKIIESG